MRGNRCQTRRSARRLRSIPAYAGEPVRHVVGNNSVRVYPRVCGGTQRPDKSPPAQLGLSPRMRGNPVQCRFQPRPQRSIPAYAGEPPESSDRRCPKGVYPRVCGGTEDRAALEAFRKGLSPRMRGNRRRRALSDMGIGSIPAYAGEPRRRNCRPPDGPVYPRVCGGTHDCYAATAPVPGLSPRMRGNPQVAARLHNLRWSIPAYAGEPRIDTGCAWTAAVYPRVCGGTPAPAGIALRG